MDPFIGEIRVFGFNFAPYQWAFCDGTLLSVAQFSELFSILGTTFGGNGQTTFALPSLQSRAPMHWGSGAGLSPRVIGEEIGATKVTLTPDEMPGHNHVIQGADPTAPDDATDTPSSNAWLGQSEGTGMFTLDTTTPDSPFAPNAIGTNGGSQPHNNLQPLLTLNFCIAMYGIYPSRN